MSSATFALQARLKVLRDRTAAAVAAQYDALPDLHDTQAEPFARQAAHIVRAGQLLAAGTMNSFVARAAGIRPVRLDPAEVAGAGARNGVDPVDAYQRPFGIVWKALGDGAGLDRARALGRDRLLTLATTDVWLATRAAAAAVDRSTPKITGWVRVADAGACDLCASVDGMPTELAADMAGHPGCGCTQEPTFADSPESEPADLEAVDIHDHDELGPVLYQAGQHFEAA